MGSQAKLAEPEAIFVTHFCIHQVTEHFVSQMRGLVNLPEFEVISSLSSAFTF
jgi:hypothetical protein